MSSKALFDPGFSKCLTSFQLNIEYFYQGLASISNFKQKKYQFSVAYPKLMDMLYKNIGFYVGCMLWGAYLKSLGSVKIEEQPFVGQEYDEENSTSDVNYILDFIKGFDRDTKYYMNKPFKIEEKYIEILNKYLDFIKQNEGFTKTDTTDKIVLVGNLEKLEKDEIDKIEEEIQKTINTGKLEKLLDFCDKI